MIFAWMRQKKTRNAGVVDVIWTISLGALAIYYALLTDGWAPRRVLVALLAGLWSGRLALHLIQRVWSEPEDGRYRALRESWGSNFDQKMFWFFQAQALLSVLLSLVFLFLCLSPEAGWRWSDAFAIALWALSILGEGIADRQLARWRSNPDNRGRTCRAGLWRYSRHPNYFFEWLHWLVYPVLGFGLAGGWALWIAPAAMLFFILKVTGIPPTEERAVQSRGDDYRQYQRTTNAFFPGPPRKQTEHALEIS